MWARNSDRTVCWIYKTQDDAIPDAGKRRSLKTVVPDDTADYDLIVLNPWTGAVIGSVVVLPTADPGGGAEWLGSVKIWEGRMDAVTPTGTGFDERPMEDVLFILRKR